MALAAIYDGTTRTEAAKIRGVGLQIIRDWVLRFNARGPDGLLDGKSPGQPSKLNDTQRQAIARIALPSRAGARCDQRLADRDDDDQPVPLDEMHGLDVPPADAAEQRPDEAHGERGNPEQNLAASSTNPAARMSAAPRTAVRGDPEDRGDQVAVVTRRDQGQRGA